MAPLAAYSVFVATFSAMAAVLFGMMTALLAGLGRPHLLDGPAGVLLFLALVFLPGLAMGRWLVQRPLRRAPLPGE